MGANWYVAAHKELFSEGTVVSELGGAQMSTLLESLPGIANVLRSPVADALVGLIRAGAGIGDFSVEEHPRGSESEEQPCLQEAQGCQDVPFHQDGSHPQEVASRRITPS
jgi:hypothetical protein